MKLLFGRLLLLSARKSRFVSTILTRPTSGMSNTGLQVVHDDEEHEFYIQLDKGTEQSQTKAVLQYSHLADNYVDLEHTEVPYQYRGQGIAKILAEAAFNYFVENKIDMRPSCTYLQKFYKENPLPQYRDRVKWD